MPTPEQEQRLHALVDAFLTENAHINLSAFRTEEACWTGNVLDSLAFLDLLPRLPPFSSLLDLGTGGGFPLFPLALMLPHVTTVGLDATKKKVDAVNRIAQVMHITNALCICERAETLGRDAAHREHYDIVTSRAVAELSSLLEYASPFVKPGGHIVLWKSMDISDERKEALIAEKKLSCRFLFAHSYTLPGTFGTRQLLVYEKTSALSQKFPRAIGVPKKDPLR